MIIFAMERGFIVASSAQLLYNWRAIFWCTLILSISSLHQARDPQGIPTYLRGFDPSSWFLDASSEMDLFRIISSLYFHSVQRCTAVSCGESVQDKVMVNVCRKNMQENGIKAAFHGVSKMDNYPNGIWECW